MTVIAWDGRTLAADKLASWGQRSTVTKVFRHGDELIGVAGSSPCATALRQWIASGRDVEKWPRFPGEFTAIGLHITREGVFTYYSDVGPWPVRHEEPFIAIGCGKEFAMAAMHLGKSSMEAVEVACALNPDCGNGIDTLELDDPHAAATNTAE